MSKIRQLLSIQQCIRVKKSEATHEEEHDGAGVVQFVHGVEVGHTINVADVDDGKVLDLLGDLVEDLVLAHAVWVVVAAEADHDKALVFGEDCLVDVPA